MADESPYTLEERIVTSAWVLERHRTGDTLDKICGKFTERFKKNLLLLRHLKQYPCIVKKNVSQNMA